MADEEPTTPSSTPPFISFGEFRKGTKLYPVESINQIVEKVEHDATVREQAVESKLEVYKTEVAGQMTAQTQAMEEAVAAAKTELRVEFQNNGGNTSEGGIHYMGVLDTKAELDALTDVKHGQFYIVSDVNKTFIWTEPAVAEGEEPKPGFWKEMSASVDLSNYVTKSEIYSKEEIDLIKERANANEQKIATLVAACSDFPDMIPLSTDEYTVDEIASMINKMLIVMKTIAGMASSK